MNFFTVEISDPEFESDNIRNLTVKSSNLKGRADISIFIPNGVEAMRDVAVCILLHGVYGSHWAWVRKGGVHKITQRLLDEKRVKPMILIMPSDGLFADGSGYLPHSSADYEKWISEDVPQVIIQYIEQVSHKSPFFLTGLSMGGYGALRIGAKNPERFTAFSGHSAITEFDQLKHFYEPGTFGQLTSEVKTAEQVFEVLTANKISLRPFRFDCGRSDQLFEANLHLHNQLLKANIYHDFEQLSGGHDWDYWCENIVKSLEFFSDKI